MEYKCHETKQKESTPWEILCFDYPLKIHKLSERRFSVANITDLRKVMRNRKEQILGTS